MRGRRRVQGGGCAAWASSAAEVGKPGAVRAGSACLQHCTATSGIPGSHMRNLPCQAQDRVETSPEQMASASAAAEAASLASGRATRVVGWYHSHPHITVLPSHVDLRTQVGRLVHGAAVLSLLHAWRNSMEAGWLPQA